MLIQNDSIGRKLLVLDKYLKQYVKTELKQYHLKTSEGFILLVLYSKEGITPESIREELHYDKGLITKSLLTLEEKNYVKRVKNATDSRSVLINLSEQGKEFKPLLIKILKQWNEILLSNFSDEELLLIRSFFDKMHENVMKVITQSPL